MKRFLLALVLGVISISANASLWSRAGGAAYYDDVLDITWLADANYAQTSGYSTDGRMKWDEAFVWIGVLNAANHLGANNWRLPMLTDTGAPGCLFSYDGVDCGYNVDTSTGEMASLFYDTLGNLAIYDTSGNIQAGGGLSNTGPFSNVGLELNWYGTEYALSTLHAWYFFFSGDGAGLQTFNSKNIGYHVWAVSDGDTVVPIPAAFWLFGSALGLLGWMRKMQS